MNHFKTILFLLLIFSQEVFAQDLLNLDQAIAIGLKNNYSIQISNNNATMASNDNYIGNAGILPSLTLNASGNLGSNDVQDNFTNAQGFSIPGLNSNGI